MLNQLKVILYWWNSLHLYIKSKGASNIKQMKWEQLETSIHQPGRVLRVLRLQLSIHFLCCSADIVSPYPWPPAAPQRTILGQLVGLKNASPSHPNEFLFSPVSSLNRSAFKLYKVVPVLRKSLCTTRKRSWAALTINVKLYFNLHPQPVIITALSQFKEDHCKISAPCKNKQTLLHGWVISITLWPVYAQF